MFALVFMKQSRKFEYCDMEKKTWNGKETSIPLKDAFPTGF